MIEKTSLITCDQYKMAVDASIVSAPVYWSTNIWDDIKDTPVVYVCYDDAQRYVDWMSTQQGVQYRIPTFAEWVSIVGVSTPSYSEMTSITSDGVFLAGDISFWINNMSYNNFITFRMVYDV